MKIRIGGKDYQISGACPVNGPKVSKLRAELEVHGAEAFAASKKLNPHMACLLYELIEGGAEIVLDEDDPTIGLETSQKGDRVLDQQTGER